MPGYRCWHVPASPVQTVVSEPVLASPELGPDGIGHGRQYSAGMARESCVLC